MDSSSTLLCDRFNEGIPRNCHNCGHCTKLQEHLDDCADACGNTWKRACRKKGAEIEGEGLYEGRGA